MDTAIPRLFDRHVYLQRQSKASPAATQILHASIAEDLSDRLAIVTRDFEDAILIGDQAFVSALSGSGKIRSLVHHAPLASDALNLVPDSCAAIFSVLDLHTINDVPGYLAQCARALKPDGLLMLAFFAGETLYELRESWLQAELDATGGASPRVAPMISVRELGGLLQRAGLAIPVADLDRTIVRYSNAFALMQDVKAAGFANPLVGRATKFVPRGLLTSVATHYQSHFVDADNRIRATIEIAWANAWKPHPSQQQPLKPGSARARLADALNATERKI